MLIKLRRMLAILMSVFMLMSCLPLNAIADVMEGAMPAAERGIPAPEQDIPESNPTVKPDTEAAGDAVVPLDKAVVDSETFSLPSAGIAPIAAGTDEETPEIEITQMVSINGGEYHEILDGEGVKSGDTISFQIRIKNNSTTKTWYLLNTMDWAGISRSSGGVIRYPKKLDKGDDKPDVETKDFSANPSSCYQLNDETKSLVASTLELTQGQEVVLSVESLAVGDAAFAAGQKIINTVEVWRDNLDKSKGQGLVSNTTQLVMSNSFTVIKEIIKSADGSATGNVYDERIPADKVEVGDRIAYWVIIRNMSGSELSLSLADDFLINGKFDTRQNPLYTNDRPISAYVGRLVLRGKETDKDQSGAVITRDSTDETRATLKVPANKTVYLKGTNDYQTEYLGDELVNTVTVTDSSTGEAKTASVETLVGGRAAFEITQQYQIWDEDSDDWSEEWLDAPGELELGQKVRFKITVTNAGGLDGLYTVNSAFNASVFAADESADTVSALEPYGEGESTDWDAENQQLTVPAGEAREFVSGAYTVFTGQLQPIRNTVTVTEAVENGRSQVNVLTLSIKTQATAKFSLGIKHTDKNGSDLGEDPIGDVKKTGITGEEVWYTLDITNEAEDALELGLGEILMTWLRKDKTEAIPMDTSGASVLKCLWNGNEVASTDIVDQPEGISALAEDDRVEWDANRWYLNLPAKETVSLIIANPFTETVQAGDKITIYSNVYERTTNEVATDELSLDVVGVDPDQKGRLHIEVYAYDANLESTSVQLKVLRWYDKEADATNDGYLNTHTKESSPGVIFDSNNVEIGDTHKKPSSGETAATVFTVPLHRENEYTLKGTLDVYVTLDKAYAVREFAANWIPEANTGNLKGAQSGEAEIELNGGVYGVWYADDDNTQTNARVTVSKNAENDNNGSPGLKDDNQKTKDNYCQDNIYIYNIAKFYYVQNYVSDLDNAGKVEKTDTYDADDTQYDGYVKLGARQTIEVGKKQPIWIKTDPIKWRENYTPLSALTINGGIKTKEASDATHLTYAKLYDALSKQTKEAWGPKEYPSTYDGDKPDGHEYKLKFAGAVSRTPATGDVFDGTSYITAGDGPNEYFFDDKDTLNSGWVMPGSVVPVFWDRVIEFAIEDDARNITAEKKDASGNSTFNYDKAEYIRQFAATYKTHYTAWKGYASKTGNDDLAGTDGKGFPIKDAWKDEDAISATFTNDGAKLSAPNKYYVLYAANANDTAKITFSGAITDEKQSVSVEDITESANVDLYLTPRVQVRYHLMNYNEAEDSFEEVTSPDTPKDDTIYLIPPKTSLPTGATVIDAKWEDLTSFVTKPTVTGYSYWHVYEGGSTDETDHFDYYKSNSEVEIDSKMVNFDAAEIENRNGIDYPVIDLYAYEGVRMTVEKTVKDEGFIKGTFYFKVDMSEDGGPSTPVYFREVKDGRDTTYEVVEAGTPGAIRFLPLVVEMNDEDDSAAENALELFRLLKGENVKYTVTEVSPTEAGKADNIQHQSELDLGIDIKFENYDTDCEWENLKSADNSTVTGSNHKADGASITGSMAEDEKAFVTVCNKANFYIVKHYVSDLNDAGQPETTDVYESYNGYVPFEKGFEVRNLPKDDTADKLTYAKAHEDISKEDTCYPEKQGWSIVDQSTKSGNSTAADATAGKAAYTKFVYAGGKSEMIDKTTGSTYAGKAGNENPNQTFLKAKGSEEIKPGAIMPVFWDRVAEFVAEGDERNVTAAKDWTNIGSLNNIRQSAITYKTHYALWDALVGGKADLGDFSVKDSWQNINAIDVTYTNSLKEGYIFHSADATPVGDSKGQYADPDIGNAKAVIDNTKGGTHTDLYLTPLVVVRYHLIDLDGTEVTADVPVDDNYYTVDLTGGAYKNVNIQNGTYLTKFAVKPEVDEYSSWHLHEMSGAEVPSIVKDESDSNVRVNYCDIEAALKDGAYKPHHETCSVNGENVDCFVIDLWANRGIKFEVTKKADKDAAIVGEEITYTVTIKNTGTVALNDFSVTDYINGEKFVISEALYSNWNVDIAYPKGMNKNSPGADKVKTVYDPAKGTINFLYAGATLTITYKYTVPRGAQLIDNEIAVKPNDPDLEEQTATTSTRVASVVVDKVVRDSIPKNGYKIGDSIYFTMTVTNTGDFALENVVVSDPLENCVIVAGTGYKVAAGGKSATITGVMKPGDTVKLEARYTIKKALKGDLKNTATVRGSTVRENPDDEVHDVTDTDSATVSLNIQPSASPTVSPSPTPAPIPNYVSYTGRKIWEDDDDAAGKRPSEIFVRLLRDGVMIQEKRVTAENDWNYSFTNLPDIDVATGKRYFYSISERMVDSYYGRTVGYSLVNTYMPDGTSFVEEPSGYSDNTSSVESLEQSISMPGYVPTQASPLMATGDDMPVYPFVFGGVGVLAVVGLLLSRKKRKKDQ